MNASPTLPESCVRSSLWPVNAKTCDLSRWRRLTCPLIRAYSRRRFPSYGYLQHWWGLNRQEAWANAPMVEIKGRVHGLRMRLSMADFFQRIAYFVGSYHELDVLAALDACLRAGDAFLDGGANIGLVTMHAAGIVGPTGVVDSFECNPRVLDRLRWHVDANSLSQVRVHAVGLGEREAELTVRLPGINNAAAATLGAVPDRYGIYNEVVGVTRVRTGDAELGEDPVSSAEGRDQRRSLDQRPLTIKLDIEGFEVRALQGLVRTLDRRRPAIIVEVNHEMLAHSGNHAMEMFHLLWPRGYHPFGLDLAGWRGGHRLKLCPLWHDEFMRDKDVLWVARDSPHWERLAPLMQPYAGYWRDRLHAHHESRRERWTRRARPLGLGAVVKKLM